MPDLYKRGYEDGYKDALIVALKEISRAVTSDPEAIKSHDEFLESLPENEWPDNSHPMETGPAKDWTK